MQIGYAITYIINHFQYLQRTESDSLLMRNFCHYIDTKCELPDSYSPSYVEAAWYPWWEKKVIFTKNLLLKDRQDKNDLCDDAN